MKFLNRTLSLLVLCCFVLFLISDVIVFAAVYHDEKHTDNEVDYFNAINEANKSFSIVELEDTDGKTSSEADCRISVPLGQYGNETEGYHFDVELYGELTGKLVIALYTLEGQMTAVRFFPAVSHFSVAFPAGVLGDYARIMWLDGKNCPLCTVVGVDLTTDYREVGDGKPVAYSAPIDENHIAETTVQDEVGFIQYIDNEILIFAADGVVRPQIERLCKTYNAEIVGMAVDIGFYELSFSQAGGKDQLDELIERLRANPLVDLAELNYVNTFEKNGLTTLPNDDWEDTITPLWNEGYPYGNNWSAEAINAPSAWKLLMEAKDGQIPCVSVGVIDSMFDAAHRDLDDNIVLLEGYSKNANTPPDTGRCRVIAQYADTYSKLYEDCIHGSHVAGIIGAEWNNGVGINGIAINPQLICVALANTDDYHFTINGAFGIISASAVVSAIDLILSSAENNKAVINYSVADFMKHSQAIRKCLNKQLDLGRDFVIVSSAGNSFDQDTQTVSAFNSLDDSNLQSRIIVVGAVQFPFKADDEQEGFSVLSSVYDAEEGQINYYCYGERIDVVAPGEYVLSAVSPSSDWEKNRHEFLGDGEYRFLTGTSMAAPHVSGVATLVWQANPALSGDQVKSIVIETADIPINVPEDTGGRFYPNRMVNAHHAAARALGTSYEIRGNCGNNAKWFLSSNKELLLIFGEGAMNGADGSFEGKIDDYLETFEEAWFRYHNYIKEIEITDGITRVGDTAFWGMDHVEKISLSQDVTEIGQDAFGYCYSLTSIAFPENLRFIGSGAFARTGLTDVIFTGAPPTVTPAGNEDPDQCSFSDIDGSILSVLIHYPSDSLAWQMQVHNGYWMGYRAEPYGQADWELVNARYEKETGVYVLTEDYTTWTAGGMWYSKQITDSFSVELDYYTGSNDRALGGGDGMAVAFYADKNYSLIDSLAGELGFTGCKGYGIELDTWANISNCGDPDYNHVALIEETTHHRHLIMAPLPESEDEQWHHLRIEVTDQICSAYVDGNLKIQYQIEPKENSWLGIMAGTGDGVNLHAVKNVIVLRH